MNVLIIEDDYGLASQIRKILQEKVISNRVKILSSYDAFLLEKVNLEIYDIILIDIFLWDKLKRNGINIVEQIRNKWIKIPIIMISSFSDCDWIEKSFYYWANDYIIKPFRLKELVIRIEQWFKMYLSFHIHCEEKLTYKWLEYSIQKNEFLFDGKTITLTKKNKYLLSLLLIHSEKIVTNTFLLEKIWGDDFLKERNTRISVLRLKKALWEFWLNKWIHNIRGEGYMLRKI